MSWLSFLLPQKCFHVNNLFTCLSNLVNNCFYSDKLRIALSLSDGDLPLYIIRMKEFGYPPGWKLLKEESLKIFDGKEEG